jgi:Ni,Fe-hydrogenase I large subunit
MQISRRGFLKYCSGSAAALGLPLSVVGKLEEALGVIHAFDPCLSCAVHMIRPDRKPVVLHTGAGC